MRALIIAAGIALTTLAAACGGDDDDTSAPTSTGSESVDAQAPTMTATITGSPSPTPEATPIPAVGAEGVILALQNMGLPIVETEVYTAETDPNEQLGRPHGYTSKANFADGRLERQEFEGLLTLDSGGSVEAFDNPEDAADRFEYLDAVARGVLGEYHYLRGSVILRVSKSLTPDQAAEYESAFQEIVP